MKTVYKHILCVILVAVIALPCSLVPASAAYIPQNEASLMGRSILLQMTNGEFLTYVYDRLYECLKNFDTSVNVTDGVNYINSREAQTVNRMLKSDHPEIFWYNGYSYSYTSDGLTKILPSYTMTKEEALSAADLLSEAADKLCSGLNSLSDYEISLALHDRLASKVDYAASENDQTAYGALVDGIAVCAGYSAAYQYLLQRMGIPAFTVTGSSLDVSSNVYIAHAWNLVLLNGEYYYTDVTWDDQTSSSDHIFHDFFNVTDEKLSQSHIPDNMYIGYLPACTATDENYFVQNNSVITDFNAEKIAYMLRRSGYTAEMYATVGAVEFVSVIQDNIWDIVNCLNLSGGFSYGFLVLRNEVVFYIESDSLPKNFLTVNITLPENADIAYTSELYSNGALVYSVTSNETTVFFEDLSLDDYTLKITADGYYTNTAAVSVDSGTVIEVKMRLLGDINDDDVINFKDSNILKHTIIGRIDPIYFSFADIDSNNTVNSKDSYQLKKIIANAVAFSDNTK